MHTYLCNVQSLYNYDMYILKKKIVFYFTGTVVQRIGRQLMEMCVDIREIYDQNLTQILPSGPKISAKNDGSEKVGKS